MKNKKAQAEDIFADFIIALIFIITTIILISCTESGEEAKLPFQVIRETAELYNTDIITMLRTDLRNYGYREMTFAEVFAIIGEGDEERYPWIFGEAALVDDKECTETFEIMIAGKLLFGWDIQLYSEGGSELFRCVPRAGQRMISWIPSGIEPISHKAVFCRQTSLWIPLHDGRHARLEVGVCP